MSGKKKKSLPKKQHTIPKFYLDNFADKNQYVWVYDRVKNELRNQPTKDTSIERHFYTLGVGSEEEDYIIETEAFAKRIEPRSTKVITKVLKGEKLSDGDHDDLCVFLVVQHLRTTSYRRDADHINQEMSKMLMKMSMGTPERAAVTMKNMEKDTGNKTDISPEEMAEFVSGGKYDFVVPKEYSLSNMIDNAEKLFPIFRAMRMTIVKNETDVFLVTSDNPVSIYRHNPHPFYGKHIIEAEITCPISPMVCVYLSQLGNEVISIPATDKMVRQFNVRTMLFSDRYVIGRKRKQLDAMVKEIKLENAPRRPHVQVDSPFK